MNDRIVSKRPDKAPPDRVVSKRPDKPAVRTSKAAPPLPEPRRRTTRPPAARDDGEAQPMNPARDLVAQLHSLMKAVLMHDERHSLAQKNAAALCQVVAAVPPPFVLQFVAGGVFLDRTLVPLDFQHFERCLELTRALHRLAAHELSFETALPEQSALRLGRALASGLRGKGEHGLKDEEIPGLSWREIPFAQSGIDAEGVDSEVAAIAHTVLGLSVAEQIAEKPEEPWPWNMGLSVIRRLEKGLATNADSAMRVVEFAPEGWPVPRRALSASQLVLQVLTRVGIDAGNRRAAAHAALALGLQGLRPRGGVSVAEAADELIARITRAPIQAQSGIAPQCLLVASLLHVMGTEMRRKRSVSLMIAELVELAYEMERARCPEGVPFDLTRADLLAFAVEHSKHRFSTDWVRAVIKVCGTVPVGACVQLADGRVGMVIEPGPPEDPWCPVVFVNGRRVMARQPVMLVPPTKLRRFSE